MILYLIVTDECNLRCKHCFKTNFEKSKFDFNFFHDYLLANQYSINEVIFYGGEPLLEDYLNDVSNALDFIKSLKIRTSLISNLNYQLLSEKQLSIISKLDSFSTSWTPSRFQDINSLKSWKNNIELIHSKYENLNITLLITLVKELISIDPKEIINFIRKIDSNLSFIKFEPYIGKLPDENHPLNIDVDKWLSEYFSLVKGDYSKYSLFLDIVSNFKNNSLNGIFNRHCIDDIKVLNIGNFLTNCPSINSKNLKQCQFKFNNNCFKCKYYKQCGGTCQLLEFDSSGCPGYKILFKTIEDYLNEFGTK